MTGRDAARSEASGAARGAVSLDVRRLRAGAAGLGLLLCGALALLTPRSRPGLVLYGTNEGAARVASDFSRRTGTSVTFVRLSTGPLLARIAAEGRRPGWTLAWFDGDTSAASLDRAGLLLRGAAPDLRWTALGRGLLPADRAWTPVAATLAGVSVRLSGAPFPQSRATGQIGMADPSLAGPAYLQLAGLLSNAGGWPAGRAAIARLHGRVRVAATSPNVVAQLRAGQVQSAWLQGATAYYLASRDRSVRVEPTQAAVVLPSVIVEAAGAAAAQREAAGRFLRFATSESVQAARMNGGKVDAFAWPTVQTRASPPAALPRLASVRLVHLDPYRWGAVQGAVTDAFETEVARR